MMKKRNDEGFALTYVVVVIFVLCSIAIALMSSTLRTLQAQENMVQRMKDKYAAMGEIERLVAELEYACEHNLSAECIDCNTESATINQAKVDFIDYVSNLIDQYNNSDDWYFEALELVDPRPNEEIANVDALEYDYIIVAKNAFISAKIHLNLLSSSFEIITEEHDDHLTDEYESWLDRGGSFSGESEPENKFYTDYSYEITNVTFDFTSYEISSIEGGESDA